MSQFYPVSIEEMRRLLRTEKGWAEEVQCGETVFTLRLTATPFIQIRVYSGISANSGASRKVGKDSIKVAAINTNQNIGWIKAARVHRVTGWEKNLKERVCKVIKMAKGRLKGQTGQVNVIQKSPAKPFNVKQLSNAELRAEMEAMRIESNQQ
jgi:hypothetical protein